MHAAIHGVYMAGWLVFRNMIVSSLLKIEGEATTQLLLPAQQKFN